MTMQLSRDGIEYAHAAIHNAPPDTTPPDVYLTGAWHPMEWHTDTGPAWDALLNELQVTQAEVDAGTVRLARILVAGPDAPPGNAVPLPLGRGRFRIRLVDVPEVIVREGTGSIDVA